MIMLSLNRGRRVGKAGDINSLELPGSDVICARLALCGNLILRKLAFAEIGAYPAYDFITHSWGGRIRLGRRLPVQAGAA